MTTQDINIIQNQTNNVEQWFDEMVANLRYDQALLEIDVLEENKKKIYDTLISGNQDLINHLGRQASSAFFIKVFSFQYLNNLF